MTTPAEPQPLEVTLIPAAPVEGDPPGQLRVARILLNGIEAAAPTQLVYVGTELRAGDPLLAQISLVAYVNIGTAEPDDTE